MMKETPVYLVPGKKTSNSQFYRNYWCYNYDVCLNIAAHKDLYLDCTHCFFKENVIEDLSIFINKKHKSTMA